MKSQIRPWTSLLVRLQRVVSECCTILTLVSAITDPRHRTYPPIRRAANSEDDAAGASDAIQPDMTCAEVLPILLKRNGFPGAWYEYATTLISGDTGTYLSASSDGSTRLRRSSRSRFLMNHAEYCLRYDEKPLDLLNQKRDGGATTATFVLKHIDDMPSPIRTVASRQVDIRGAGIMLGTEELIGGRMEGPIPDFSPAGPVNLSVALVSAKPPAQSQVETIADAGPMTDVAARTHAVAVYPHVAERNDDFDVKVGDTFVILRKDGGWWGVHHATPVTSEQDVIRLDTCGLRTRSHRWGRSSHARLDNSQNIDAEPSSALPLGCRAADFVHAWLRWLRLHPYQVLLQHRCLPASPSPQHPSSPGLCLDSPSATTSQLGMTRSA